MKKIVKRKRVRLTEYDYSSAGAYFITICTDNRKEIFSSIVGAIHESPENVLTENGKIVKEVIESLPERFDIKIDKYVIMPNHIHLIIVIKNDDDRAIRESPLQKKRSVIDKAIGYLKMNVSKKIHQISDEKEIWQRSYYDHIIRGEDDYMKIWDYIDKNVMNWENDRLYI